MDGFVVAVLFAIGILALGAGFALGETNAAEQCKNFGKFHAGNEVYSCAPSHPQYP